MDRQGLEVSKDEREEKVIRNGWVKEREGDKRKERLEGT